MRRRRLLTLAAAPALPAFAASPAVALAERTRLAIAWRGPREGDLHHVGIVEADWRAGRLRIATALPVSGRPHGLLAAADGGFVAVALRPGRWLMRVDPAGRVVQRLEVADEQASRHFGGHVIASADARLLYTTETDAVSGEGRIGVRDSTTLRKLDDWPSHGQEPHQLLADEDGSLLVANGGIRRGADDRKLDLDRMDASLVRIDGRSGRLAGRWTLPDQRLSIRHLAWSAGGLLGLALQAEHEDPDRRRAAPALAVFDGQTLFTPPGGEGHAGDIAGVPGGGFLISHAARDLAYWWHPAAPRRLQEVARLQRAYALATDDATLIAAGRGLARWHPSTAAAMLPWPMSMAVDNHMVVLAT